MVKAFVRKNKKAISPVYQEYATFTNIQARFFS